MNPETDLVSQGWLPGKRKRYGFKYNIIFRRKEDCNYILRNDITMEGQKIGGKHHNTTKYPSLYSNFTTRQC